eukprot:GFYU01003113.1.p1 GENE.GFYU01003113.1~~GFYU01003113.1.p1  ORF type:complete len:619 (+),score=198.99 GFYU01003113.1:106-1962(+)
MSWLPDDEGEEDFFAPVADGKDGAPKESTSTRDSVIFLIDCQQKMKTKLESGRTMLQEAITAAHTAMQSKMIVADSDLVSVIFYNTTEAKNVNEHEGVYVMQELDFPDAHCIMKMRQYASNGADAPFGWGEERAAFHHVLWAASSLFQQCTQKVAYKRVIVMTCDEDPSPASDPHLRDQAIQKAKDLTDLDITIDICPLAGPGQTFNGEKFYKHILSISEDEFSGKFMQASKTLKELQDLIRCKAYPKRTQARLPLYIHGDYAIGVAMYSLYQPATKGTTSLLDKNNNPLKTVTKYICTETGADLLDSQMQYYFPMGSEKVLFTKDEVKEIKFQGEPGMRLLGFKPLNRLKDYQNVRNPKFIYPDESVYEGSTAAFSALLQSMLRKGKETVAICRLIGTAAASLRFVALVPQAEHVVDGDVKVPGGFHAVFLPYADDIRKLKFGDKVAVAEDDMTEKAKAIVKKLTVTDVRDIHNPSLQKHYAALEALALEETDFSDPEDECMPNNDAIHTAAKGLIQEFKDAVGGLDTVANASAGSKRKRAGDDNGGAERDWNELVDSGKLAKCTIPDLKEYCTKNRLPTSGKKADLVERVEEHVEKMRSGGGEKKPPARRGAVRRK